MVYSLLTCTLHTRPRRLLGVKLVKLIMSAPPTSVAQQMSMTKGALSSLDAAEVASATVESASNSLPSSQRRPATLRLLGSGTGELTRCLQLLRQQATLPQGRTFGKTTASSTRRPSGIMMVEWPHDSFSWRTLPQSRTRSSHYT
jgi:hypothetical protein